MSTHVVETMVAKAPYAMAAATTYFGLTINEWGVIVGIVCTVATTLYNMWHKRQVRESMRRRQNQKDRDKRDTRYYCEQSDT